MNLQPAPSSIPDLQILEKGDALSKLSYRGMLVAKVGLEPTRSFPPRDFKSPASRQFRHSAVMDLAGLGPATPTLPATITFVTIHKNVCSLDCVITITLVLGSTSTVSTHLHTKCMI